ncbi:MAG: formyltetrahydrofolate deformylase [Alphaproteobacteria bacterium]|nr:formyltetrahydrofolate deformylase [Alphaproteobacteria bacterium]MCB9975347.1 formyltetrahydrofolate deformylase [Rhodospirillales bacterium]
MLVLRLHCADRPGIVAAVSACLSNAQCNIEESAQFNDHLSGLFFMRVLFSPVVEGAEKDFASAFAAVADRFGMVWALETLEQPVRTLLMVSKEGHCLNDILYRWSVRHFPVEITAVVSNHEALRKRVEDFGLRFVHLPISPEAKDKQEKKLEALIEETNSELVVLARYMQILSGRFCERFRGRVINIHHSFLPGFKGAKPYHQAYERGVKLIGATAHFATEDLDEGPIIEQETVRITHSDTPEKLKMIGQDSESRVLARAIGLYAERRIFLHGKRTVIL